MAFLDAEGLTENTMIVVTSDKGDYLGDHWMGEKELFHDASARIPLIVVDPRPEADAMCGVKSSALVEAIDVVLTILDFFGGEAVPHVIEGRSLLPILHGQADGLRDVAVSEYDHSMREVRRRLGVEIRDSKLTMLFDIDADPEELIDLGADPAFAGERARLSLLRPSAVAANGFSGAESGSDRQSALRCPPDQAHPRYG